MLLGGVVKTVDGEMHRVGAVFLDKFHRCPYSVELPLPLWERVGVRGAGAR
jgi:hypothetical protein